MHAISEPLLPNATYWRAVDRLGRRHPQTGRPSDWVGVLAVIFADVLLHLVCGAALIDPRPGPRPRQVDRVRNRDAILEVVGAEDGHLLVDAHLVGVGHV